MEKKVDIQNLINEYNELTNKELKENYLKKKIKIISRIPYVQKMVLANNIIQVSCLDENNNIHIDSCKKYLFYIYTLLSNYTNLEFKEGQMTQMYELLDSNGLLEIILRLIPEKEISEFKTILAMKQDDLMINKYDIHNYITDKITYLTEFLEPILSTFSEKLNNIDETKFDEILNSITKN